LEDIKLKQDNILVLDLGSSENTTIARWIRDLGVYSEIHPHDITAGEIQNLKTVKGIILNGGKNNIVDGEVIDVLDEIYGLNIPVISVQHPSTKATQTFTVWPTTEEETKAVLKEFVFDTCKAEANWNMKNFIEDQVALVREQIGDKKVLLALSGGVDSSVVAALLIKAIGKQLVCVHVNHGLMRKNESEGVIKMFEKDLEENLIYVDASERFLGKLKGVEEPEEKRKIIGNEFIRVFEEEARKLDGIDFLAQGTIYPDIVESGTKTHKVVKSHHNVGGLPEDLQFELVEPLFQLFKDEVRAAGVELGLPHDMVYRQPFPGPGLGVRCLGEIEPERLEAVRESDAILREEFAKAGLDKTVWQYFTVVPNFKSVGVRNNERTYEYPVIIRAVNTIDAMTATVEQIDWPVLLKITDRIINEVKNVNRVCYDLSPKPGGTIEWE
jgi:GMP synthase (glutamine-hydrolysing)